MSHFKQEVITQVFHAGPALAMVYAWIMSLTLDDYYKGAGVGFILLQAAYLIWKWRKEAKEKKSGT